MKKGGLCAIILAEDFCEEEKGMFEKKIVLHWTEEDFVNYNLYNMKHHPVGKKAYLINLLMCPFLCLFAFMILLIAKVDLHLLIAEAVVLTILAVLFMIFTKKRILKSVRKSYRKTRKKDPLSYPETTLTFLEDHFVDEDKYQTTTLRYLAIKHVGWDQNGVYLYRSDVVGYILPAENFSSVEEQAQFADYIRKKIEEQKAEQTNV